jgi:hypothetical protein
MPFLIKSLADGQLPAAKGTLYICPVGRTAIVKNVMMVADASPRTVNLYKKTVGGGVSRRLIPINRAIAAGQSAVMREEQSLEAGDVIEGDANGDANVVDFVVNGVENT